VNDLIVLAVMLLFVGWGLTAAWDWLRGKVKK